LTFGRRPGTLRGANPLILKGFFASQVLDFKGYFFLARALPIAKPMPVNYLEFLAKSVVEIQRIAAQV
jgi:hypothetical protein